MKNTVSVPKPVWFNCTIMDYVEKLCECVCSNHICIQDLNNVCVSVLNVTVNFCMHMDNIKRGSSQNSGKEIKPFSPTLIMY